MFGHKDKQKKLKRKRKHGKFTAKQRKLQHFSTIDSNLPTKRHRQGKAEATASTATRLRHAKVWQSTQHANGKPRPIIEYMQLTDGAEADKLTVRANRAAKHAVLRRETGRFALQNGLFWRAKRHETQHIEYQDVAGGAQN